MSTCPSHEVYSMYIDNELPEPFKSTVQKHASECLECSQTLQNLKKVHDVLQKDMHSICFDQQELDDSFNRLKTKMRFREVTEVIEDSHYFSRSFLHKVLPVVAAALVLAIILPIRLLTGPSISTPQNAPFLGDSNVTQASFVQEKGIVSDDNLTHYTVDISSAQLTSMDLFRPQLNTDGQMEISITLTGVTNYPTTSSSVYSNSDVEKLIPVNFIMDTSN